MPADQLRPEFADQPLPDPQGLLFTKQRNDADAAMLQLRVAGTAHDVTNNVVNFLFVDIALAMAIGNQDILQRRVDALGCPRQAQWIDLIVVEFAPRVLDDGCHAAEMFAQHHAAAGEHDACKIV